MCTHKLIVIAALAATSISAEAVVMDFSHVFKDGKRVGGKRGAKAAKHELKDISTASSQLFTLSSPSTGAAKMFPTSSDMTTFGTQLQNHVPPGLEVGKGPGKATPAIPDHAGGPIVFFPGNGNGPKYGPFQETPSAGLPATGVPDSGSTAVMLGCTLGVMVLSRRKLADV